MLDGPPGEDHSGRCPPALRPSVRDARAGAGPSLHWPGFTHHTGQPLESLTNPEQMARMLERDPNYRVLRRFVPREHYADPSTVEVARGVVLDTETTGRDPRTDEVVELCMLGFDFDPVNGTVLRVTDVYSELRDPGRPIPPEASAVNHITDEMVRGKTLDLARAEDFVASAQLIIAHNAGFDRPLCERLSPVFAEKAWACSQHDVPWSEAGIGSAKLEFIASCHGLFYDGHRAETDCRVLLDVLSRPLPNLEGSAFAELLHNAQRCAVRLYAMDSRFETKALLSTRGYRWGAGDNGHEKAWYREVPESELEAEVGWLRHSVYQNRPFSLIQDTVDAFSRYSGRRAGTQRVYYAAA